MASGSTRAWRRWPDVQGAFGPPFFSGVNVNKYLTTEPVTFKVGQFALTDEQLRRRAHVVVRVAENIYAPKAEISFKAGEIVVTDLDIPKGLHAKLVPVAEGEAATDLQPAEAPRGRKVRR